MGQTCQIIRDAANQVIKVLVVDTASQAVVATAIVPRYFSGVGPPNAGTLPGVAKYNQFDRYTDTSVPSDYICTFAGSPSTSSWKQISGGGSSGSTIQRMFISSDNGGGILCVSIPPADYTLQTVFISSAGLNYKVGDILPVTGGTLDGAVPNNAASVKVSTVDGSGRATAAVINAPGAYKVVPVTLNQPLNSGTGSGAVFNMTFNHPIPVNVKKNPDVDLSDNGTTVQYRSVPYAIGYTPSATLQDVNVPAGSPGMIYWQRLISTAGNNLGTYEVDPPYLWGGVIVVAQLTDGSYQELSNRAWAQI